MFGTLAQTIPQPRGCPSRAWTLQVYRHVLDGTIYDGLPAEFHAERNAVGEYVPLRQRKPSVRFGLCRLVVEDSVSFLFGEGRFPAVECQDKADQDTLSLILNAARADDQFTVAAMAGSIGSVAIWFRLLSSRVFLDVLDTDFLTPAYDPAAPDTLISVVEAYQVTGTELRAAGYAIADVDCPTRYWHRRMWTVDDEIWFEPQKVLDADRGITPTVDSTRTIRHDLGFVPIVWIKNLPGGIAPDGACTFRPAIETSIEIDYQLSQAGRGLKYSSDPTLLIKEPAAPDDQMITRSPGDALVVSEKGDARLLEIGGTASAAVIEYVRALREMALESVHGNRSNADKLGAAQSGRAMELLYQPMLNLVDRLRNTYGRGLLDVARMIVRTAERYPILVDGEQVRLTKVGRMTLRWPPFFAPTATDKQAEAVTLSSLRREGLMSQDTAVRRTAATYDVGDADDEMERIKADEAEVDARMARQGDVQIKDTQPLQA